MGLTIKDTTNFKEFLDVAQMKGRESVFKDIITDLAEAIESRVTKGGQGPDGGLGGYSEGWKKYRQLHGRNTGKKVLDFTGSMWNALTSKTTRTAAELTGILFFRSNTGRSYPPYTKDSSKRRGGGAHAPKQIPASEKARHLHDTTGFFALSEREIDEVTKRIDKELKKAL